MTRSTEPSKSSQTLAYVALLLMALAAAAILAMDVSNYIRSVKSARDLTLAITDLQIIDDDDPRALIHFRVRNNSSLDVEIERYLFTLHLRGERVGGSYSTYLGTDPSVDPKAHREATNVDQTLAPGQSLDLAYTLYIYPTHMERVRQIQRSGPVTWQVSAEFTTLLPHSRVENLVRLRAEFEEE